MTIYDVNGGVKEQVPLHTIQSKQAMHALMLEKGFVLKTANDPASEGTEPKNKSGIAAAPAGQKNQLDGLQTKREALEERRKNEGLLLMGAKNKKTGNEERLAEHEAQFGQAREERETRGHSSQHLPQSPPYQTMFLTYGTLAAIVLVAMRYFHARQQRRNHNRKRHSSKLSTTVAATTAVQP